MNAILWVCGPSGPFFNVTVALFLLSTLMGRLVGRNSMGNIIGEPN